MKKLNGKLYNVKEKEGIGKKSETTTTILEARTNQTFMYTCGAKTVEGFAWKILKINGKVSLQNGGNEVKTELIREKV